MTTASPIEDRSPGHAESDNRPGLFRRMFWNGFRRRSEHDRHPLIWHARRYDAQLYALIVAVGVPLMGWLVSDWHLPFTQILVTSYDTKITIAALWFAAAHVYWWLELDEIRAQIKKHGLLDVEGSDYQRSTMQALYWGVIFAVIVFLLSFAIWAYSAATQAEAQWIGPVYGPVEVVILVHTIWIGRSAISAFYPLISIIQQALASQMRRETKAID